MELLSNGLCYAIFDNKSEIQIVGGLRHHVHLVIPHNY